LGEEGVKIAPARVGLLAGMFAVTRNPSGCRTIRIDVKRHERRGFIDRLGVSRRVSGARKAEKTKPRKTQIPKS